METGVRGDTTWVKGCLRWGQINLREPEPPAADVEWWVDFWRKTQIKGLVVNAGGLIAYYPTKIPYHRRSRWLGDRDLFGELVAAAKREGIRVLARIDPGSAGDELYHRHPDWFCVNPDGKPLPDREGLYRTCPNGPYYREYVPSIFDEVLASYDVDGFFGNQWFWVHRSRLICHCPSCREKFQRDAGRALPSEPNWDDPTWREWVAWRFDCLAEVHERWNDHISSRKPGAIWVGNLWSGPQQMNEVGMDRILIGKSAAILDNDLQGRKPDAPLWATGEQSKVMRVCNPDKPSTSLVGTYAAGSGFRIAAAPDAEARLWYAGLAAGGTIPWWHSIGATHEDRRFVPTVQRFFQWHAANEEYLHNRTSVANVALLYSPRSADYYGKGDARERWLRSYDGLYYALMAARIPFDLAHAERLDAESLAQYDVLVLPNVGAMSDGQVEQIRAFQRRGGAIVATHETSLYDERGGQRVDFGLAAELGVHWLGQHHPEGSHSYMRLEAPHPILEELGDTAILPFGGGAPMVRPEPAASVLLTLIPSFITHPPEAAWPRIPRTDFPLCVVRDEPGARSVYFAGDLGRLIWEKQLPDHLALVERATRWALARPLPLRVEGPGVVDLHAYRQGDRLIVHLVNLTNPNLWKGPCRELLPLAGQTLIVSGAEGSATWRARCLVSGREVECRQGDGGIAVAVPDVLDHEVVVLERASGRLAPA